MCVRAYDCGQIVITTRTRTRNTAGTRNTTGKVRNTGTGIKTKFVIAGRSTRQQRKKVKKKFGNMEKVTTFVAVIKNKISLTTIKFYRYVSR